MRTHTPPEYELFLSISSSTSSVGGNEIRILGIGCWWCADSLVKKEWLQWSTMGRNKKKEEKKYLLFLLSEKSFLFLFAHLLLARWGVWQLDTNSRDWCGCWDNYACPRRCFLAAGAFEREIRKYRNTRRHLIRSVWKRDRAGWNK